MINVIGHTSDHASANPTIQLLTCDQGQVL